MLHVFLYFMCASDSILMVCGCDSACLEATLRNSMSLHPILHVSRSHTPCLQSISVDFRGMALEATLRNSMSLDPILHVSRSHTPCLQRLSVGSPDMALEVTLWHFKSPYPILHVFTPYLSINLSLTMPLTLKDADSIRMRECMSCILYSMSSHPISRLSPQVSISNTPCLHSLSLGSHPKYPYLILHVSTPYL